MRQKAIQIALIVATLLLLALNWGVREDPTVRNFEFLPEMVTSVPYDAFDANPNFEDGKTLREPVPGTVIRGMLPLHYAATPEEAIRAGNELSSLVAPNDAKALERGATVYANYCHVCHGPEGKGDGPVAQRGFPAPISLVAPNAVKMKDGQMFHIITYGQKAMPPYAAQISREDRWKAIHYVRQLQRSVRR